MPYLKHQHYQKWELLMYSVHTTFPKWLNLIVLCDMLVIWEPFSSKDPCFRAKICINLKSTMTSNISIRLPEWALEFLFFLQTAIQDTWQKIIACETVANVKSGASSTWYTQWNYGKRLRFRICWTVIYIFHAANCLNSNVS